MWEGSLVVAFAQRELQPSLYVSLHCLTYMSCPEFHGWWCSNLEWCEMAYHNVKSSCWSWWMNLSEHKILWNTFKSSARIGRKYSQVSDLVWRYRAKRENKKGFRRHDYGFWKLISHPITLWCRYFENCEVFCRCEALPVEIMLRQPIKGISGTVWYSTYSVARHPIQDYLLYDTVFTV